jgi:hypothetical protein
MKVKLAETIWLRCEKYEEGQVLDLSDLDANQLIAAGQAKPAKPAKQQPESDKE